MQIGNNDKDEINLAKNFYSLFMYDTMTKMVIQKHLVGIMLMNLQEMLSQNMIIATYLKDHLSKEELKIVNKYIKKMHKKFIKPEEFEIKREAFMQWEMEEFQI